MRHTHKILAIAAALALALSAQPAAAETSCTAARLPPAA